MIKYLYGIKKAVDLKDCAAFAGLSLLGIGLGVIYWPAALIVVGGILMYLAWAGVRRVNTR